ncbi:MAG TPA: transcriptional repressor, partial [Thermoleophilia bacterium]|nr:transcriptional repressor [Thermoleophilia bacterium]
MTRPGPNDRPTSDSATDTIADVFHQRNIPFTRQRRLIWEYFAGADRAATIGEAADELRAAGVGQATVYRTVTLLTDLGLLVRVQDRRGEIGFTAPPLGHSHPLV